MAAVALVGCGGGSDAGPPGAGVRLGKELRLTSCGDWRGDSYPERLAIVQGLRKFSGGPVGSPAGRGAVLDDDKAYDVLQSECAPRYARGFKLYKLYTRAAALTGR